MEKDEDKMNIDEKNDKDINTNNMVIDDEINEKKHLLL